ncbi:MAG: AI-2E family transporter, partial [Candidatus Methylomirabilis sp.]|nr:AI-2E family transporter [Deltaproteobacteria bacterium]
ALDWAETRALPWLEGALGVALPRTVGDLSATLEGYASSVDIDLVGRAAKTLLGAFSGTVQAAVAALNFLLVPVFSVYFLRSFDDMSAALYRLIPDAYRDRVGARIKEVDEVLGAFVRGQVTVCGAMAVLYSLGLWLVGVGPWLLIGLLSGFGNLVPYLGTAVGIAAAVLAVLVQFGDWQHLAGALAVFAVVQTIEGFVLTPRIVGEKVGLHPVVVMVAILAGGEVFGFTGILLAVPVTAALGVVFRQLLEDYRASALFAESRAASEPPPAPTEPEDPPAAPTA